MQRNQANFVLPKQKPYSSNLSLDIYFDKELSLLAARDAATKAERDEFVMNDELIQKVSCFFFVFEEIKKNILLDFFHKILMVKLNLSLTRNLFTVIEMLFGINLNHKFKVKNIISSVFYIILFQTRSTLKTNLLCLKFL